MPEALRRRRATLAVSPSHDVALRPNTRYVLSAQVKTEADARVRLSVGNSNLKEAVGSAPGQGWTRLGHEFETGPNEFWLGRTAFRLEDQGTAWLKDISLKEAAGGPELLWEADVNRRTRGYYNPVDCFMLDELVEAANQRGIYLQLCLITRDLYMSSLKDPASPSTSRRSTTPRTCSATRWRAGDIPQVWPPGSISTRSTRTCHRPLLHRTGRVSGADRPVRHLRTTSTGHPPPETAATPSWTSPTSHFYLRPPTGSDSATR